VVAILDSRLTSKRYGSLVVRSLPPARLTRRFSDVYRFFSVGQLDADYALTVWLGAENQDPAEYHWQLTRLPDGRTRDGRGMAPTAAEARWAGVLAGVQRLQDAIRRGDRRCQDFQLEVRLPGIGGPGAAFLQNAQPELRSRLQTFKAVNVMTLEDKATYE
jgi:hypothetical protein